eukprot:s1338_g16.t1
MSNPDFLPERRWQDGRAKVNNFCCFILTPLAGCGAHAEGVLGRGWPTECSYPWGQRGKQGFALPYDSENDELTCSLGVHAISAIHWFRRIRRRHFPAMGCNSTKPAEAPDKSHDKGKDSTSTGMGRAQFIIDNPGKLLDFYDLDKKKLGEGSYGYVCKGKNKATNAIRAVKTIAKGKMKNIERFKQEIAIMKMMDHPNIIKLYESFEDLRNIYLVMELCSGGELFDRIIDAGSFTEVVAAILMQQIIRAVYYMHQNNCHLHAPGMSRIIWVRSEVFDHGVFNTSIRWSSSKVLNFMTTLKSHMNTTTLSKEAWLDLSVSRCKPALTETEASTYWTVFSVLQQSILGDPGDVMDIRLIGIILICQIFREPAEDGGLERARARRGAWGAVPAEFTPDGGRQDDVLAAGWQTAPLVLLCRYELNGYGSHPPSSGRGLEFTQALHSFVKQHLGSWLQIASLTLQSDPASITAEEFDILGLILCGGTSKTQPLWKLSDALPELASKSSMPTAELRKAVVKLLCWNEDIYTTDVAKDGLEPRAKTLNISNVLRGIWFHRPHNAEIEYLNIADCKDSTIYVTARIRYCLITGCENTTIILGGSWAATQLSFHDLHHPQLRESLSSCGCALLQDGELYRYICIFVLPHSSNHHWGYQRNQIGSLQRPSFPHGIRASRITEGASEQ